MALTQSKRFKGMAGPATLYPEIVVVAGRIAVDSSGDPVAPQPRGATVAHGGAGIYTITLTASNGVPAILTARAWASHDSATVVPYVQVRTVVASTGVITLTTGLSSALGTAANLPTGANLQFEIFVRNAQVTG